eukprot:11566051-Heterocapsa_arctica.AAC.1
MQRHRANNHDIIFEDWWTCKNCKAKGPQLNKRTCTHFISDKKRTGTYEDEDGHGHNIQNKDNHLYIIELDREEDGNPLGHNKEGYHDIVRWEDGMEINRQARQRAKERQMVISNNKNNTNIKAQLETQ